MSDRDLRRILNEIIEDLDSGRVRPPRPRRLVQWLGAPVLAASLGLGVAGCDDRAIGYADDAEVQQIDAGTTEDYAAPPVDGGAIFAYGIPPVDEDAGTAITDAGTEEWDGGDFMYGVPFEGEDAAVDASLDPPAEAMYAAPGLELSLDGGAPPDPVPPNAD